MSLGVCRVIYYEEMERDSEIGISSLEILGARERESDKEKL